MGIESKGRGADSCPLSVITAGVKSNRTDRTDQARFLIKLDAIHFGRARICAWHLLGGPIARCD